MKEKNYFLVYICMTFQPTIIADEKIPFVRDALQPLGKLTTLSGRDMNAITIRNADILIVRSVTRVDELLLDKSNVRYVATASTGYDHIDTQYLEKRGIHFFAAAGCNANAVSEYVTAAIAYIGQQYTLRFNDLTLGIIGVGKIGNRVADKARAMGMKVLLNDPPLKERTGSNKYLPLETVLQNADIVTLHVPLSENEYPTIRMVNSSFMDAMKADAFLINTSRGAVVDEDAMLAGIKNKQIRDAVLDVWCNEPGINTGLLERVVIGTPHIAGHSIDGKVNATVMVYNDLCKFLGMTPEWKPEDLPRPEKPVILLNENKDKFTAIIDVLLRAYPIHNDDAVLRKILLKPESGRESFFDSIRNEYPMRREFDSYHVTGNNNNIIDILCTLGFKHY